MKKIIGLLAFILVAWGLFGLGEQTLRIGADLGWGVVENKDGVTELASQRPWPVLVMVASRQAAQQTRAADMLLPFDESLPDKFSDKTGNYTVTRTASAVASGAVVQAGTLAARYGAGAARFTGNASDEGPLVIVPSSPNAMLFAGKRWGDFSIEFWVQPFNMDTGEQVFLWASSKRRGDHDFIIQRIQCAAFKSRLRWTFVDFFASAGDEERTTITLTGSTPIVPRMWSHHLVRFDARTGLLEYLVNGTVEAVTHATPSGREWGEVYTPLIGMEGSLVLGKQFTGMIDEFRIGGDGNAEASIAKYPSGGGRIETRSIDLGEPNTQVVKVEANTGRLYRSGGKQRNEYTGKTTLRFSDEAALQFFIRMSDSPYLWVNEWRPFTPGTALEAIKGRYVQLAVQFYPSGDGEASPYLDEIRIVYKPNEPPLPPILITALAKDGAVDLSWKGSPDIDTAGYFVYYGTASSTYFGEGAVLGASPIDVGKRTNVHIDGLKNGVLYYFAVAAYDSLSPPHLGAFSREVTARPLRMVE